MNKQTVSIVQASWKLDFPLVHATLTDVVRKKLENFQSGTDLSTNKGYIHLSNFHRDLSDNAVFVVTKVAKGWGGQMKVLVFNKLGFGTGTESIRGIEVSSWTCVELQDMVLLSQSDVGSVFFDSFRSLGFEDEYSIKVAGEIQNTLRYDPITQLQEEFLKSVIFLELSKDWNPETFEHVRNVSLSELITFVLRFRYITRASLRQCLMVAGFQLDAFIERPEHYENMTLSREELFDRIGAATPLRDETEIVSYRDVDVAARMMVNGIPNLVIFNKDGIGVAEFHDVRVAIEGNSIRKWTMFEKPLVEGLPPIHWLEKCFTSFGFTSRCSPELINQIRVRLSSLSENLRS